MILKMPVNLVRSHEKRIIRSQRSADRALKGRNILAMRAQTTDRSTVSTVDQSTSTYLYLPT